jgi:hypothetical protein
MSPKYLNALTLNEETWPPVARHQPSHAPTVTPDDPLLTSREAAVIMKVSVESLKKWRQRLVGPAFIKYDTGAVRYQLSVLLQYVRDCKARR